MKRKVYIISTLFIVLFVGIAGGLVDIIQPQAVIDTAQKLGYPLYFFFLLGICKIVGSLILVLPQKFNRVKDLAYAGFTLDFVFASYSHYSVQSDMGEIIIPLALLVILAISFTLRNRTYLF